MSILEDTSGGELRAGGSWSEFLNQQAQETLPPPRAGLTTTPLQAIRMPQSGLDAVVEGVKHEAEGVRVSHDAHVVRRHSQRPHRPS